MVHFATFYSMLIHIVESGGDLDHPVGFLKQPGRGGGATGGGSHNHSNHDFHTNSTSNHMPWQHSSSNNHHDDVHDDMGSWQDDVDSDEPVGAISVMPTPSSTVNVGAGNSEIKKKKTKKDVFICAEVHCGKQFPRSFALRRHMRIHTGTKPYACDYEGCSQRFNTSGNLSRHKRIHSGERPYPCIFATCGKRFNTSTKLKRHMRIHFPEGQNLFRCIGVNCSWSCDNYKEFAQHQKLHHNIIVGAQQESASTNSSSNGSSSTMGTSARTSVATKDTSDYFSPADHPARPEYDTQVSQHHHSQPPPHHHHTHPTGSFLYGGYPDKNKAPSAQPPRKLMGQFFGGAGELNLASLPMLQKDQKKVQEIDHVYSEPHRMKPTSSAFPSYSRATDVSSSMPAFSISSESTYASSASSHHHRSSYGGHYSHSRSDEDANDESPNVGYRHHHHHAPPHHVLRPPPQGEDMKFGGFAVPPPMNPAAPEFTGEELSVVLELMKDSYC